MRVPNVQYPFEVTIHQGVIENIFIDAMSTRGLFVDRPTIVDDWQILLSKSVPESYRIEVTIRHLTNINGIGNGSPQNKMTSSTTKKDQNDNAEKMTIHTKYIIGCDGAHSWVRKKLGFTMIGENTGKF